MATRPIAFDVQDVAPESSRSSTRSPSSRVDRVCFRSDTRPPEEIFPGGFASLDFEAAVQQATAKAVRAVLKDSGRTVKPVLSPIRGADPATWNKPLLYPFAPGSEAAKDYDYYYNQSAHHQAPIYRNAPTDASPLAAMHDIAPESGVALTLQPQWVPLFPVERDARFKRNTFLYAVWVEHAYETYKRQFKMRPGVADIEEVVVRYVPFYHVLAAVDCTRNKFGATLCPLQYQVGVNLQRNPHAEVDHLEEARLALTPLLGQTRTINWDGMHWSLQPSAPQPGGAPAAATATASSSSTSSGTLDRPPNRPPPRPPTGT